jgi:hypothetical protein
VFENEELRRIFGPKRDKNSVEQYTMRAPQFTVFT